MTNIREIAARSAAVAVVAALFAVFGLASPAAAVPVGGVVDAVGWWTNGPGTAKNGGGFEVALRPDGSPQSVAAVQVTVDKARMSKLTISLTEAASVGSQFNRIRVCRAASGWQPANPGALADAPRMDCSAPFADLTPRSGGWDGDLSKMLPNGGTASLGFVGVGTGQAPVSFYVDVTSVTITGEGSIDAGGAGSGAPQGGVDPPSTSGSSGDTFTGSSPSSFDSSGSSFGGFGDTVTSPTTAVATPLTNPDSLDGPTRFANSSERSGGPSRPWFRLLFLTPLAALIGVGLVYARRLLDRRMGLFG